MHKYFKNINFIKINFLLIIAIVFCTCNLIFAIDFDAHNEYVINVRSKRIHSLDCASAKRISEYNKIIIIATLSDLEKDGFEICKNCNAGVKKSIIDFNIINKLLYNYMFTEDYDLKYSFEEYINSINTIGEWYVNNIPTYCKDLQFDRVISNGKVTKVELPLIGGGKDIRYYSNNEAEDDSIGTNISLLRASESAVLNYLSVFDDIVYDHVALYPCELLENSVDDYDKAGDDCTKYIFSCLNYIDNSFTSNFNLYTGFVWRRITTHILATDRRKLLYGLSKLGFDVYDAVPELVDLDNDGHKDFVINKLDYSFRLRKGDILVRDGHVHIYLGDGGTENQANFGWGRVNNIFPRHTKIWTTNNSVKLINSANGIDTYTRVFRYRGGNQ